MIVFFFNCCLSIFAFSKHLHRGWTRRRDSSNLKPQRSDTRSEGTEPGHRSILQSLACGGSEENSGGRRLHPVCVCCAKAAAPRLPCGCCLLVQNDFTKPTRHIKYDCTNTRFTAFSSLRLRPFPSGSSHWMPRNKHMANTMAKSWRTKRDRG